jgi:hypothetical protein
MNMEKQPLTPEEKETLRWTQSHKEHIERRNHTLNGIGIFALYLLTLPYAAVLALYFSALIIIPLLMSDSKEV